MLQGTAFSVNTYFVGLEQQAGLCRTVDIAKRTGMTLANGGELPTVQSFTLGSVEVFAAAWPPVRRWPTTASTASRTRSPGSWMRATPTARSSPRLIHSAAGSESRGCGLSDCDCRRRRRWRHRRTDRSGHDAGPGCDRRPNSLTHPRRCVRRLHPKPGHSSLGGRPSRGLPVPDEGRRHQRHLLRTGLRIESAGSDLAAGHVRRSGRRPSRKRSSCKNLYGLRTARGGGTYIPPTYTPAPAPVVTPTPISPGAPRSPAARPGPAARTVIGAVRGTRRRRYGDGRTVPRRSTR